MRAKRTYIQEKLKQVEAHYNIKVLHACETGSRAWGFASPDSDYDIRVLYMHEPDWYVSLRERNDALNLMLDDGELDISGWDLRKSLQLLYRSNGAMLERIQSPIIYCTTPGLAGLLATQAARCFSPVATLHHYRGMAFNSFAEVEGRDELKLKKLFYALRAALACKWVFEKNSAPPIVFDIMVRELDFDAALKERIGELVKLKAGVEESYMHPAEKELEQLIRAELARAEQEGGRLEGRSEKNVDLDGFLRHCIKSYWV